jgi:glycosyltransferase involved in cell wall biosynthesis
LSTSQPLVSIICLCYNQARFLNEALQSVLAQDYSNLELILVDDASTDDSVSLMRTFVTEHPSTQLLPISINGGNCRAFNRGLALARGKYVIDLAADDVMLPSRVSRQVAAFEALDDSYGVVYTNARLIDENSKDLGLFYSDQKVTAQLPTGDVYRAVLGKTFICPPTMMMKKRVLDELGGYDESLHYEDFDFWVRSSRNYQYYYLDEILTARREVSDSLSRKLYARSGFSTLKVCRKALLLNNKEVENQALGWCVRYHLRQAFFTEQFELVEHFGALLTSIGPLDWLSRLVILLAQRRIRTAGYYKFYLKHRYGMEISLGN